MMETTYTMNPDPEALTLALFLAGSALSQNKIAQNQFAWAVDFAAWEPGRFFALYLAE